MPVNMECLHLSLVTLLMIVSAVCATCNIPTEVECASGVCVNSTNDCYSILYIKSERCSIIQEHVFSCDNGDCVWKEFVCDGVAQCPDDSDEKMCQTTKVARRSLCGRGMYTCSDGLCIPRTYLCDKVPDCADGGDEVGCSYENWISMLAPVIGVIFFTILCAAMCYKCGKCAGPGEAEGTNNTGANVLQSAQTLVTMDTVTNDPPPPYPGIPLPNGFREQAERETEEGLPKTSPPSSPDDDPPPPKYEEVVNMAFEP